MMDECKNEGCNAVAVVDQEYCQDCQDWFNGYDLDLEIMKKENGIRRAGRLSG